MNKLLPILAVTLACTGCASVMNETTHPIRVETKTQSGDLVSGADCSLTNDYGTITMKSGGVAQARRSSKDLDITCVHPGNPKATARATSRANGGMWGNLIIGGAVGAIVDHNRGTAYTYPTWMQLVFGKTLIFDRHAESGGQPVAGAEPGTVAATAATPRTPVTTNPIQAEWQQIGKR